MNVSLPIWVWHSHSQTAAKFGQYLSKLPAFISCLKGIQATITTFIENNLSWNSILLLYKCLNTINLLPYWCFQGFGSIFLSETSWNKAVVWIIFNAVKATYPKWNLKYFTFELSHYLITQKYITVCQLSNLEISLSRAPMSSL